jgi:subtilase family serine protease
VSFDLPSGAFAAAISSIGNIVEVVHKVAGSIRKIQGSSSSIKPAGGPMVRWKSYIPVVIALLWIVSGTWSSNAQNGGGDRYVQSPLHVQAQSPTEVLGFKPEQIQKAYGFDQWPNRGLGQTIGIVVPYDDNRIEEDLAVFSTQFHLTQCTSLTGCFRKIFSTDKNPGTKGIWSLETALDVEWAHAIAQDANILVVEAPSDRLEDLLNAVDVAVGSGATVVSMSWGTPEFLGETLNDGHFNATNIMFVAASGNAGPGGFYPAASSNVIGVGATRLSITAAGNYVSESAWSGTSGGLSLYESEPSYQISFPILNNNTGTRGIPDVSYGGDPTAGYAVYSSHAVFGVKGWFQLGGTSAAAPQWAGLLAIANASRAASNPIKAPLPAGPGVLYDVAKANPSIYNDITSGATGTCNHCSAGPGYDYVTGLGTPKAFQLIQALVNK